MSSFIPIPVKVCSYCYSQHLVDATGFQSIRIDAWFCHKYCHNLALIVMGETRQSDNPEYYASLMESRKKIFPEWTENINGEIVTVSKITNNKMKLHEDKRYGQIKIVKIIY